MKIAVLVLAVLVLGASNPLEAQPAERMSLGMSRGWLNNSHGRAPGTQGFWAVQLSVPASRDVAFEASVNHSKMSYGDSGHGLTFGDLQFHWFPIGETVRPYLGAGIGGVHDALAASDGSLAVGFTISGSAGLRVQLAERVAMKGEFRARTIPTGFNGRTYEAGLGVLLYP